MSKRTKRKSLLGRKRLLARKTNAEQQRAKERKQAKQSVKRGRKAHSRTKAREGMVGVERLDAGMLLLEAN